MKSILRGLILLMSLTAFKRAAVVAVGTGITSSIFGQANMFIDTVFAIKANGDTVSYMVMFKKGTYTTGDSLAYRAASNRRGLVSPLQLPISTATQAAITTNTNNINLKKSITDSGRCIGCYATGYDLNKVRDSVVALIPAAGVPTSRTISTTSPLTGGGDLSANRTFAINNAAAGGSTKGAASFNADYFDDNGSGNISFAVTSGTGTVSASAVTINQPRGKITYNSPNIIAAGTSSFTLTNSFITSTSIINVGINGNGSNLTSVNCYIKSQTSGSAVINVQNLSLLNLFNSNMVIDFFIVN